MAVGPIDLTSYWVWPGHLSTPFVWKEACCGMVKSLTTQISKISSKCYTTLMQEMEIISPEEVPGSFTRDSNAFCNKRNSTFTTDFAETAEGVNQCRVWICLFINNCGWKQALRWHGAAGKKLSCISCWGSSAPGQECKACFPCHTKGSIYGCCFTYSLEHHMIRQNLPDIGKGYQNQWPTTHSVWSENKLFQTQKNCITLLIHTESKVSLEVLINTKPNFIWSGSDTQHMTKAGSIECTLKAQLEYSYP